MILQTSISAEYKQCSVICSWIKQVSEFKRYFFTSSLRTVMHSTEMNKGLKEDFLRIWNVVWKLWYIRCRGGPKLYAGKRDIWCTMKIISKISSTCMSWISLHEEAPARSLKISLIRRNCKLFFSYISIHHWETRLTAIWLNDRRNSSCSKLCFLTGKSQFSFTSFGSMYVFFK